MDLTAMSDEHLSTLLRSYVGASFDEARPPWIRAFTRLVAADLGREQSRRRAVMAELESQFGDTGILLGDVTERGTDER